MTPTGPLSPDQRFRDIVAADPARPAIVTPDRVWSYGDLARRLDSYAARLAAAGVGPGATVNFNSRDPARIVPVLLATAALGARFLQNVGDTTQPGLPPISHGLIGPDAEGPGILIDDTWDQPLTPPALPAPAGDTPWILLYTSGTTGLPKFIEITQAKALGRALAVADEFVAGQTVFASLYPADGRPFLIRILAAMLNGATFVAGQDPAFWRASGVTRVVAPVAGARRFFAEIGFTPRLPVIEVAGSPLNKADRALLLNSFEVVDDTYGASETGKTFSNIVTRDAAGAILVQGQPRDAEIELIAEGQPVTEPGRPGTVRVRNSYMVDGYLGDPVATARHFADGWFYPGDIAQWSPEGALVVSRRVGEVFNLDGTKLALAAIDHVLKMVPGVVDACCFHSPKPAEADKLIAFLVFDEDTNRPQVTARARQLCTETLGQMAVPKVMWPASNIPRGADGQPDRAACAAMILKAAQARGA